VTVISSTSCSALQQLKSRQIGKMNRALQPWEEAVIVLLREFEKALDNRRLTFQVMLNREGAFQIYNYEASGSLKALASRDRKAADGTEYHEFWFSVADFEKYLQLSMAVLNMKLYPNCTLELSDGFRLQV
jgi:hypothetical protein